MILVHGAANSGRVWTFWQDELARHGWSSHAIDLRGHGTSAAADLAITRMADYADDVIAFARTLRQAPVLVGWSMGGLVAMMAAMPCNARACVGLAPSTPARAFDASVALRTGVFGPEEYGITGRDPDRQPSMAERYDDDLPFSADHFEADGATHWGLVLNRRVVPRIGSVVSSWLEKNSRLPK